MDIYGLKNPWVIVSNKYFLSTIPVIQLQHRDTTIPLANIYFLKNDWQNIAEQLFDFKTVIGSFDKNKKYIEYLKYEKITAIDDNLNLLSYTDDVLKYLVRV